MCLYNTLWRCCGGNVVVAKAATAPAACSRLPRTRLWQLLWRGYFGPFGGLLSPPALAPACLLQRYIYIYIYIFLWRVLCSVSFPLPILSEVSGQGLFQEFLESLWHAQEIVKYRRMWAPTKLLGEIVSRGDLLRAAHTATGEAIVRRGLHEG